MRGRNFPTSSDAPATLTSSTKRPGQSSKLSCPRTPKKPSDMGCGPNDRNPVRSALICWTRRPPMQRSSESFAALACAPAKAQAQLVNPEKSLSATIRTGRAGEIERTFRYAPLSSGLEIVRKTLSEHEIAFIQTTAIDQATRMLHLTTMLAHSSGEWISSQWPVCAIAEIANPHRMGAALTYARRYALFTLVGITGEDDVDAPDLCASSPPIGRSGGELRVSATTNGNGRIRAATKPMQPTLLSAEQSAVLRDRLLTEIAALDSQNRAITWAKEALAHKNRLVAADAKVVEDAFEQKLSDPSLPETNGAPTVDPSVGAGA